MSNEHGRRIVIDLGFEAALAEVSRAIRDEGLQMIARIDVRDHFWRDLGEPFRQYHLLIAWSPELAIDALRTRLEAGSILPVTFAVYELADGETAVVVKEPLSPAAAETVWQRETPALASVASREAERVARIVGRIERSATRETPVAVE